MLWKRVWIILAIVAVAGLTAAVYLVTRDVSYETDGTIRLNPITTEAAISGELGGVAIDLDPEIISSSLILDAATTITGEPTGSLNGQVKAYLEEGARSGRVIVTGEGPTPESAQARTLAVIEAYRAYVAQEMTAVEVALRERHAAVIAQATALQAEVRNDPSNSIANTNLMAALGEMSSLQSQLNTISSSGAATTVINDVEPGEPTVPTSLVVLALALMTGLIVGVGAALIRDQFDNRLRGSDEIEEIAGIPSLGELRWDRSVKRLDPPMPVASTHRTDLSEGLRAVRSTLQVLIPPHSAVVVLTSVEPGDGKSFVSSNLALAWARAGKSVILVGGDLRRPDLARYFGEAADGEGVSELLSNHEDGIPVSTKEIEARLNVTRFRRLRLLPAGLEPADPADLLAGSAYEALIDRLRSMADIVLIDSPPAMGIADASLLSLHADGAVVIASVGRTNRALLADTVGGLRANGVELLGVVANRGRRKLPKTYSAYYMRRDADRPVVARVTPDTEPLDEDVIDDDHTNEVRDVDELLDQQRSRREPKKSVRSGAGVSSDPEGESGTGRT